MQIRPYGDTANDGIVQLSFTLPLALNARAREAARRYAMLMGISNPLVAHAEAMDKEFSFFVIYGACSHTLDPDQISVDELAHDELDFHEINELVEKRLGRRITVVGAAIESDAHTVGIDAIFNAKGYAGNYGLERFPAFRAINLGAQVSCEALLRCAAEEGAEAILVSQVVTQKNVHIHNLTKLIELAEAEEVRERYLFIVGGPRISHAFAKELGYDAGFGPGSNAMMVASYIAQELIARSEYA
ncbi:MAG TPA: OAM dimerization domain-containing protein [Ktedonobacteraceae bacterium]|nr:OAM dimerization domain-containing protein [Ktedonobacteraceae bacterium]